jgi:hypothetical protein
MPAPSIVALLLAISPDTSTCLLTLWGCGRQLLKEIFVFFFGPGGKIKGEEAVTL